MDKTKTWAREIKNEMWLLTFLKNNLRLNLCNKTLKTIMVCIQIKGLRTEMIIL